MRDSSRILCEKSLLNRSYGLNISAFLYIDLIKSSVPCEETSWIAIDASWFISGNLYLEIYSTNIHTSKDNIQSARALLKLCQEITEGTTLVSPNDKDFTSLYSTVDKRKKIKMVIDRHKEENIEIESIKENRPLKSMRNKSSRAKRKSSIKEENESFDNAM